MIQTLTKNWWLLGLCAVLDAVISVNYLVFYDAGPDFLVLHGNSIMMFSTRLAVAAGACAIAASIWRSAKGKSWLLLLNGLALSAYGLTPLVWRGPLSYRLFVLLVVVMAMTVGILALRIARTLRHRIAEEWLLGLAGAASVGFGLAFLALGAHWIQLERRPFHHSVFLWFCSYFGFSAICMMLLALRLRRLFPAHSVSWETLPTLGNPKRAH